MTEIQILILTCFKHYNFVISIFYWPLLVSRHGTKNFVLSYLVCTTVPWDRNWNNPKYRPIPTEVTFRIEYISKHKTKKLPKTPCACTALGQMFSYSICTTLKAFRLLSCCLECYFHISYYFCNYLPKAKEIQGMDAVIQTQVHPILIFSIFLLCDFLWLYWLHLTGLHSKGKIFK